MKGWKPLTEKSKLQKTIRDCYQVSVGKKQICTSCIGTKNVCVCVYEYAFKTQNIKMLRVAIW